MTEHRTLMGKVRVWTIIAVVLVAACSPLVGPTMVAGDRGIGGTGISDDDRGIGGTGIVGTITAFGSIFVNGFEIEFDQNVPVNANGESRSADDLKVGQIVALIADVRDGELTTGSIEIQPAVVGQVEQSAPGAMVVAGQAVDLGASGFISDGTTLPAVGDWVEVSGLRDSNGVIQASLVEARDASAVTIRGTVEESSAGRFTLGGLTLSGAAGVRSGDAVVVTGAQSGGVLDVTSVTVEPAVPFGGEVAVVSVEGIVARDSQGANLKVGGVVVRGAGQQTALEPGARVSVVGRAAADGIVVDDAAPAGPEAPNRSIQTLQENRGVPSDGTSRNTPPGRDEAPVGDRGDGPSENVDINGRGGSTSVETNDAPPTVSTAPAPGDNAPTPSNEAPPDSNAPAPNSNNGNVAPPAVSDPPPADDPPADDNENAPPANNGSGSPPANSR